MRKYLVIYRLDRRFWHLPIKRFFAKTIVCFLDDNIEFFAESYLTTYDLWNYCVHKIVEKPRGVKP